LGILVMLAAAASLIGRLGAYYWLADLAAHFSAYYLLLAVVATPVFLAAGWRWSAGLAFAVIGFNAWVLLPVRPAPVGACATSLMVLQANVQGSETTAEQFAVWWAEQGLGADVLALLEVPPAWESWLQQQRAAYPFQAGVLRDDPFGVWVLSRQPGLLTVQTAAGDLPWVRLALAGSAQRPSLEVLVLHPPPPVNQELSEWRNQQLAAILALTTERRVVVGDFNLTPWSPWNSILLDRSQLRDAGAGLPPAGTWPAFLPAVMALPIDRTWVSAGVSVAVRRVLPARGLSSDHRAVWSELCVQ
jgi:endonuclease/exonuclease/phosphatase (EEP) superfamily protein YafD